MCCIWKVSEMSRFFNRRDIQLRFTFSYSWYILYIYFFTTYSLVTENLLSRAYILLLFQRNTRDLTHRKNRKGTGVLKIDNKISVFIGERERKIFLSKCVFPYLEKLISALQTDEMKFSIPRVCVCVCVSFSLFANVF